MTLNHKRFNISSEVTSVLPEHISSESPDLVVFLEKYLEFIETNNKSLYFLNTIENIRDIDTTDDQFLAQLQNEIGQAIPRQFSAEPRLLYKHLTELYRSRGTIDSIKAFFRFFYDDEVEIYFPKDDILSPSDGKWFSQTDDIISDPSNFAPSYTYTLTADTTVITGIDDNALDLIFDGLLVYVDDVRNTDFVTSVKPNTVTKKLDYFITFPIAIASGKVIKIYDTGAFTTQDGFLSSYKKIQDSYYYQKFSYVLRTGSNADLWKNSFNRLIHPAGFIFFGEILLTIYLNSILSLNQPGRQVGGLPFPIVIPVTDAKSKFVKYRGPILASYILKELTGRDIDEYFKHHHLVFGMREYFDQFKFKMDSPISMWSSTNFADVNSKKVDGNIEVEIYQSTAGGPAHAYTVTPPNAAGTILPVIVGPSQHLPYI
jgi:hypothetical protein